MKKILFPIIMLVFMLTLVSITGEVMIRVLYPFIKSYNLEMWRYARDLKMPMDNPRLSFHHFPDREGDYYGVNIKTNSFGFRDNEYAVEKKKKRILFIGDSFTLGWGVKFDSIYSKLLEKQLASQGYEYEVINTGIGNYNSRMECELFKLKGLQFRPDIVVLMYFVNDAEPVPVISNLEYSFISKSYLFAFLFDKIQKIKVLSKSDFNWKDYYGSFYREGSQTLPDNRAALNEIATICKRGGIKTLYVNIPELHQLKDYPLANVTDYVRSVAEENQIPFLDLLPVIQDENPESLWVSPEDAHANERANAIFSQAIYNRLESEKYLIK